jgi:uncharacterized membrane protein YsdA (DUF1294 family)
MKRAAYVFLSIVLFAFFNEAFKANAGHIGFYLTSVNLIAFILFSLDKLLSAIGGVRIPERVLLLSVAVGGVVGGAFAQGAVNHKISKSSFQLRFMVSAAISILLMFALTQVK